jgi:hypothetical protein
MTSAVQDQDQHPGDAAAPAEAASDAAAAGIRLDLHPALAVLGFYDGVYVVVSDMPMGARLSAGRSNGNFTWSLLPAELEDLSLVLPDGRSEAVLTVSIVTPDPDGYEFASTAAQFNVLVAEGISTVPFSSLRRIEPQHYRQDWSCLVQRAVEAERLRLDRVRAPGGPPAADRPAALLAGHAVATASVAPLTAEQEAAVQARLLAAARIEWRAEEEARFQRARAQWQAEAEDTWVRRSAELAERHARELRDAETRWHAREQERFIVNEALWSARLAAQEIHWRSEESQRFAAAIVNWRMKVRTERWRRAACWFAFAVTIGSLMIA